MGKQKKRRKYSSHKNHFDSNQTMKLKQSVLFFTLSSFYFDQAWGRLGSWQSSATSNYRALQAQDICSGFTAPECQAASSPILQQGICLEDDVVECLGQNDYAVYQVDFGNSEKLDTITFQYSTDNWNTGNDEYIAIRVGSDSTNAVQGAEIARFYPEATGNPGIFETATTSIPQSGDHQVSLSGTKYVALVGGHGYQIANILAFGFSASPQNSQCSALGSDDACRQVEVKTSGLSWAGSADLIHVSDELGFQTCVINGIGIGETKTCTMRLADGRCRPVDSDKFKMYKDGTDGIQLDWIRLTAGNGLDSWEHEKFRVDDASRVEVMTIDDDVARYFEHMDDKWRVRKAVTDFDVGGGCRDVCIKVSDEEYSDTNGILMVADQDESQGCRFIGLRSGEERCCVLSNPRTRTCVPIDSNAIKLQILGNDGVRLDWVQVKVPVMDQNWKTGKFKLDDDERENSLWLDDGRAVSLEKDGGKWIAQTLREDISSFDHGASYTGCRVVELRASQDSSWAGTEGDIIIADGDGGGHRCIVKGLAKGEEKTCMMKYMDGSCNPNDSDKIKIQIQGNDAVKLDGITIHGQHTTFSNDKFRVPGSATFRHVMQGVQWLESVSLQSHMVLDNSDGYLLDLYLGRADASSFLNLDAIEAHWAFSELNADIPNTSVLPKFYEDCPVVTIRAADDETWSGTGSKISVADASGDLRCVIDGLNRDQTKSCSLRYPDGTCVARASDGFQIQLNGESDALQLEWVKIEGGDGPDLAGGQFKMENGDVKDKALINFEEAVHFQRRDGKWDGRILSNEKFIASNHCFSKDNLDWGESFSDALDAETYYTVKLTSNIHRALRDAGFYDVPESDSSLFGKMIQHDDGDMVGDRRYHWRFENAGDDEFKMINRATGRAIYTGKLTPSNFLDTEPILATDVLAEKDDSENVLGHNVEIKPSDIPGQWEVYGVSTVTGVKELLSLAHRKKDGFKVQQSGQTLNFYIEPVGIAYAVDVDKDRNQNPKDWNKSNVAVYARKAADALANVAWAVDYGK